MAGSAHEAWNDLQEKFDRDTPESNMLKNYRFDMALASDFSVSKIRLPHHILAWLSIKYGGENLIY